VARPLNYFLCGCVKSRVHDNGKPKTGQQLGRCVIEEGAAGVRNEMKHIQREPPMALRLAAWVHLQGDHVKILFTCMF
jgi:hypothetical protein